MKRKAYIILPIALALALVVTIGWSVVEQRKKEAYRTNLENIYERSFYELVDGVGNMEVKLSKLLITETPESSMRLLSEIWHQADTAQSTFSMLPMQNKESTAKFVNQLGDYCKSLSEKVAQGAPVSQEQRDELGVLREQLTTVGNQMRDIQVKAIGGELALWEATLGTEPSTYSKEGTNIDDPLANVGHTGVDYPSLVYDGPFSDAQNHPTVGLTGAWVDYDEAERIARAFVGESRIEWTQPSSEGLGDIPTWGIEMMLSRDGVITVQITKQGGHILWMIPEHTPATTSYDLNQCYDAAIAFLSQKGYPPVTLSYYQAYNGIAVYNMVPVQDHVLLYSDLIKIQVSLETGQVIGIETGNYLRNHQPRTLPTVTFLEEDALLLASRLKVKLTRLCLIPKLTKEILCYEITGTFMEENYILYIDALTGKEIDLLKIIDVEGGQLAL